MKTIFFYVMLLTTLLIRAQSPGSVAQNFGIQPNFNGEVSTIAVQNDNKMVIGGSFYSYNGIVANRLIRLNNNGTKDIGFNIGSGFNNLIRVITIQNDGKILVGGSFTNFDGTTRNRLVRLNDDGSLDTTFNIGIGFNNAVNTIEQQSDGKILVGGNFTTYNGENQSGIIRLNIDGSKDYSFNLATTNLNVIKIQSDGKILAGGFNFFRRINPNGTIDDTLLSTGTSGIINDIEIQTDGKIIVGGFFTNFNSVEQHKLVRLNNNGTIDNGFIIDSGFDREVKTIEIQNDGKIILGGDFLTYKGLSEKKLIRLNDNGSKDSSFNIGMGFEFIDNNPFDINGRINTVKLNNNELLVGGIFNLFNNTIQDNFIRLNTIGGTSTSYNMGSGLNNIVNDIICETDGKMIVCGNFTSYQGEKENKIIKLNVDGTKDNLFNADPIVKGLVNKIIKEPDGKILCGGDRPIRLNSNGTFHNFYISNFTNSYINDIILLDNGKIIIAGDFEINGSSNYNFARLNTNGTIDNSFITGTSFNLSPTCLALQTDNKILVGGLFTSYNGLSENRIIRLNEDGTKDNTFNVGSGFGDGAVFSIVIQPDEKILVGGSFTTFNGSTSNRIVRLNSNGTIDNTFNTGIGFDLSVSKILLQNDGKILVGGNFTTFNGISKPRIVRLNDDGSVDDTFEIGTGFDFSALPLAIQNNGNILVGGRFINYNGSNASSYLIELNAGTLANESFNLLNNTTIYPNPVKDVFYISSTEDIEAIKVYNLNGQLLFETMRSTNNVNVEHLESGLYLVKIKNYKGEISQKFIKE